MEVAQSQDILPDPVTSVHSAFTTPLLPGDVDSRLYAPLIELLEVTDQVAPLVAGVMVHPAGTAPFSILYIEPVPDGSVDV